jgi:hypothetical protein
MVNVKGTSIASRILWVTLNQGDTGIARLSDDLTAHAAADTRALLEGGVRVEGWYPLARFVELNVAIDRVFGRGDLELVRVLGRYSADASLTTVLRLFYKVGTVKWLLERSARLWNVYYDSGHFIVRRFAGKEVEVEIKDFAAPHRVHCMAVQGWCERSLELSGVTNGSMVEESCRASGADRCRWHATWR